MVRLLKPENMVITVRHGGGIIMLWHWCNAQNGFNNVRKFTGASKKKKRILWKMSIYFPLTLKKVKLIF